MYIDWNDEEDGEWEKPLIKNPVCVNIGCGEWKRPVIRNPKYKGKWIPPLIDNPNYKGEWKPKQIPNPYYYEDENPYIMPPIVYIYIYYSIIKGSVAIEVWSVDDYITYDNIIIGSDEAIIKAFAKETFIKKHENEINKVKKEKKNAKVSDYYKVFYIFHFSFLLILLDSFKRHIKWSNCLLHSEVYGMDK